MQGASCEIWPTVCVSNAGFYSFFHSVTARNGKIPETHTHTHEFGVIKLFVKEKYACYPEACARRRELIGVVLLATST